MALLVRILHLIISVWFRIHVVLNDFDICPNFGPVPTDQPFFAVVDVFGSTKEVCYYLPLLERNIRSFYFHPCISLAVLGGSGGAHFASGEHTH